MKYSETELVIARNLLAIHALKLQVSQPFTWSSGLKSPVYCDNRVTLSHPEVRTEIKHAFAELVKAEFPDTNGIAAVATAGIAHASILADFLDLPLIYVRSSPKGHGLEKLIEGDLTAGSNWLIIEDLISTGGSSLKVADILKKENQTITGMAAIITYGFEKAETAFANANVKLRTLTNFGAVLHCAEQIQYIRPSESDAIRTWISDPEHWNISQENDAPEN